MKHLPRLLLLLAVVMSPGLARADLRSDVEAVLENPRLKRGVVGVEIIRLGAEAKDDQILFQKDAHLPLIPASNLKILTTAAALNKLGPEFKFRTSLLAGEPDVAIIGAGDPSFGDANFLRGVGWDVTTVFENWADQLVKRQITTVRDVIVDDGIFDEQFLHPRWPGDQIQKHYVAEVGGFNLNANVLDFYVRPTANGQTVTYVTNPDTQYADVSNTCTTGSQSAIWLSREPGTNKLVLRGEASSRGEAKVQVTIHDPPMYAAAVFAEVLKKKGITVTGEVKRDRTIANARRAGGPDKWKVLAIHETPITTVVNRANKDSVNMYAESLCKLLGFTTSGAPGSWQNGTAALGDYLKSIGVAETEFKLDDGCGLSKSNAISAEALAKVLTANFHSPSRDVFRGSLSVAGVDGTLDKRFRGSDLRGRVFAKSGFVNGVCTLSGYLRTRDDQWYAFSIMMNRLSGLAELQAIQERVVKAIDSNASGFADSR